MKGTLRRIAVIALATYGLVSCGGVSEGTTLFDSTFWDSGPLTNKNNRAELGLAEMAKGNYAVAEVNFDKALKINPKNVHALLGLGILYQNTGRLVKSREMYESVLAIRPADQDQMVVWKEFSTRPVSEIASVNLALLESGGVPMGRGITPGVGGAPGGSAFGSPMLGRTAPTASVDSRMKAAGLAPTFTGNEKNILSRFKTLIALRDQGLITTQEYTTRRQANIGALLPLTSPPPAAGLDRSVPSTDQITGRLRAIGRALEMRAITVGQHSSERTMILNAMMPAAPVSVANPGTPPKGLMEAADAVRKLESLQNVNLISTDEYAKERAAIERSMQPTSAPPSIAKTGAPTKLSQSSGPQPAVHLSSYRTKKAAVRGWSQLKRAHRALLSNLKADISKIDLGPGKGIFYRLKAGPLDSEAAASSICRKLKNRRQYCEPSFMKSGG